MAHNNIEIEIQVNIEKSDSLLDFLSKNADFQSEKRQIDEYFSPKHEDFLGSRPVTRWLRIRDDGKKRFINYKNWHHDDNGKSLYCDEYETTIDDPDQIRKIFLSLNLKSIGTVDKIRKIWIYQDYEIAIDSVKGLGDFVEIEYVGKDGGVNPKVVTDEMISFLKKLDCGKIKRNHLGYPFLILFPEEAKYETY